MPSPAPLRPIPGLSYLQLFVPADPINYPPPEEHDDEKIRAQIRPLVQVAVEVAAGSRPLSHLKPARFNAPVRRHLSAWLRAAPLPTGAPGGKVHSVHARDDGEYFGTAEIGGHHYAFTGSLQGNTLQSFRLL